MRRSLLVLLLTAGCLRPSALTCPSGTVCPANTTCVETATGSLCATQGQLSACEGKPEGATCDDVDARMRCTSGVCVDLCGNLVVDPGESCDDGNRNPDDGCSAVCRTETCGSGGVDVALGEECDDGLAYVSGDGCSSSCQIEIPVWRELATGLDARSHVALAHDLGRNEVVAFGGLGSDGHLDDTWILRDGVWNAALPARSPPRRSHHSMIYDRARQRVVLFGGESNLGLLADTWEWDGVQWTERTPAVSPFARRDAQVAYDVARARVVLFGGSDAHSLTYSSGVDPANDGRSDTWEWDGATWTEMSPSTAPVPGPTVQLVYDESNNYVVACVGAVNEVVTDAQTWTWNGTDWTSRGTCASASPDSRMTFRGSGASGRVVLLTTGGDLFEWTGTQWEAPSGAQPIADRWGPGFAFDGSRLVVLGGHGDGDLSRRTLFVDETWRFEHPTWIEMPLASELPDASEGGAFAYDNRRGEGLMFGGSGLPGETWRWNAGGWVQLALSTTPPHAAPPASIDATMTHDSARDRYVLYIGTPGPALYEFDGTGWLDRTATDIPPGRAAPAIAFDAARDVSVLFGGSTDDTWTWNGTAWTQHTPATMPPPRTHTTLAYDPVRERVVMFGGTHAGTERADTWEWDGATWSEIQPQGDVVPAARSRAQLVYHPLRRTLVLHGGVSVASSSIFSDLWEWSGAAWSLVHDDGRMSRAGSVSWFDTMRAGVVVFGGRSQLLGPGFALADAWLFGFQSLTPHEQCRAHDADLDGDELAGCADPDCWGRCSPTCPPGATCASDAPRCGDGQCDSDLEDVALCPGDCT